MGSFRKFKGVIDGLIAQSIWFVIAALIGGGAVVALWNAVEEWALALSIPVFIFTVGALLWMTNQWNERQTWSRNLGKRSDAYIEAKLRAWLTDYDFGFLPKNERPIQDESTIQFVATSPNGPNIVFARLSSRPDLMVMAISLYFDQPTVDKLAALSDKQTAALTSEIDVLLAQMGLSYDHRERKRFIVQSEFPLNARLDAFQVAALANYVARGHRVVNTVIARTLIQHEPDVEGPHT